MGARQCSKHDTSPVSFRWIRLHAIGVSPNFSPVFSYFVLDNTRTWLCVAALARLWPMSSVIAAKRPVANSGHVSPSSTRLAAPSATFGKPIRRCFLMTPTNRWAKRADRRHTSSVGLTPCASGLHGSLVRPCPFPSQTVFMKLP